MSAGNADSYALKPRLPRLYAIVDAETCLRREVRVGEVARELRDGGVRLLQYRDKVGNPQEVLRAAAEISAVFAGTDALLVMNDRADLAMLAGWRGVHVGHTDMPPEAVRRVLAAGLEVEVPHSSREKMRDEWATRTLIGVSTHNEEQVRVADAGDANYVAIGPVFATASKTDTEPVVGLEGVRRARALTGKPLVAIGGITRGNARQVIEAGADSVAVIGGLFVEGMSVREAAEYLLTRLSGHSQVA